MSIDLLYSMRQYFEYTLNQESIPNDQMIPLYSFFLLSPEANQLWRELSCTESNLAQYYLFLLSRLLIWAICWKRAVVINHWVISFQGRFSAVMKCCSCFINSEIFKIFYYCKIFHCYKPWADAGHHFALASDTLPPSLKISMTTWSQCLGKL